MRALMIVLGMAFLSIGCCWGRQIAYRGEMVKFGIYQNPLAVGIMAERPNIESIDGKSLKFWVGYSSDDGFFYWCCRTPPQF